MTGIVLKTNVFGAVFEHKEKGKGDLEWLKLCDKESSKKVTGMTEDHDE